MYNYIVLFQITCEKELYTLSYLHCYFRLYTKELHILSYSFSLLKNRVSMREIDTQRTCQKRTTRSEDKTKENKEKKQSDVAVACTVNFMAGYFHKVNQMKNCMPEAVFEFALCILLQPNLAVLVLQLQLIPYSIESLLDTPKPAKARMVPSFKVPYLFC